VRKSCIATSSPRRFTRMSTLALPSCRLRRTTSPRNGGRRGLRRRISPAPGSNSSPSAASISENGVALAHACGAQATG